MKKPVLTIAVLTVFSGLVWLILTAIREGRGDRRSQGAAAAPAATNQSRSSSESPEPHAVGVAGDFATAFVARLKRDLQTKDPLEWEPTLSEVLKPWFPRAEAVRLLKGLLESNDWLVRVRAAEYLMQLGLDDGRPVLLDAIEAGRSRRDISLLAVSGAVHALHNWCVPLDGSALFACFQRFNEPLLLLYAGLHGAPEIPGYVRQQRAARLSSQETEYLAVISGMNDADSVLRYRELISERASPEMQLLGHWALFRSTGNPADLDFVIATLREGVGLDPVSERSQPWTGTKARAFDYLQVLRDPRVTTVFEEVADKVAASPFGNSVDFMRAFGAIAYFGWDDEFVDARLRAFFDGKYAGPGVDREFMWKVAVGRNSSTVVAAAKKANAEQFQRYFSDNAPHASKFEWFDLSRVPVVGEPHK